MLSVCLFLCRRRLRICSICLIIAKRYVDWDENERTKTNCNEHEKWNAHELHEPLARRSQWHEPLARRSQWEPRTALRHFYCCARNQSKKNKNLGAKPRNKRAILGSKNPCHPCYLCEITITPRQPTHQLSTVNCHLSTLNRQPSRAKAYFLPFRGGRERLISGLCPKI